MNFLGGSYRSTDPTRNGREVRVVEILSHAKSEIETTFANDPLTRLALLRQIGAAYSGLGLVDESITTLEQVVGEQAGSAQPPNEESILAAHDFASALNTNGEFDRAFSLISDVLDQAIELAGADSEIAIKVLTTKAQISLNMDGGEAAIPMYEQILKYHEASSDIEPIDSLKVQAYLGDALLATGKTDEAQQLLSESASGIEALLGANHPKTLAVKDSLASALRINKDYAALTPLRSEIATATATIMGPEHPQAIQAKHNYASNLLSAGRAAEALPIFQEVLKTSEAVYGKDNLYYAVSLQSLAAAYVRNGQRELAQDIYPVCYEQFKSLLGFDHARTSSCIRAYRANLRRSQKWERLEAFLEIVVNDHRAHSDDDDPMTWIRRGYLSTSRVFSDPKKAGEMLEFADDLFAFLDSSEKANRPQLTATIFHGIFVEALLATEQYETSLPLLERFIEVGGKPDADPGSFNLSRLFGAIVFAKLDHPERAAAIIGELTPEKLDPETLDGYQRDIIPEWLSQVRELANDDKSPLATQRERISEIQQQIIASR